MGRAYSKKLKDQQRQVERQEKFKAFEEKKAESDAIRGIVKDLNQRDLFTSEIIYSQKNEAAIKQALASGTYTFEESHFISKHVTSKPEKTLSSISQKAIDRIHFEYGEVLNRGYEPCWWLSNVSLR